MMDGRVVAVGECPVGEVCSGPPMHLPPRAGGDLQKVGPWRRYQKHPALVSTPASDISQFPLCPTRSDCDLSSPTSRTNNLTRHAKRMPNILSCPPEIAAQICMHCDGLPEVRALTATCKQLHFVWKASAPSIIWAVAPRTILAFDDALMAVSHLTLTLILILTLTLIIISQVDQDTHQLLGPGYQPGQARLRKWPGPAGCRPHRGTHR